MYVYIEKKYQGHCPATNWNILGAKPSSIHGVESMEPPKRTALSIMSSERTTKSRAPYVADKRGDRCIFANSSGGSLLFSPLTAGVRLAKLSSPTYSCSRSFSD